MGRSKTTDRWIKSFDSTRSVVMRQSAEVNFDFRRMQLHEQLNKETSATWLLYNVVPVRYACQSLDGPFY